jgi:succinoglycan biosynthesis transport protein ExoP
VVLGLLAATGCVLVSELRNRRIRSIADIADVLGLPLLGTLPGAHTKAKSRKASEATRQRLIGRTSKA